MKSLRQLCWVVLLLGLGSAIAASGAAAQSLEDAMVSAYLTRPQLQADRARQRALDEDVARANSGWRPQVTFNAQAGYGQDQLNYGYLIPPQSIKESIHPQSYVLQLAQPIYDGGKTTADIERSESAVKAGLAHDETVEQEVLGDAIQSFFDLYRDQQLLALSHKNVDALQEELKSVEARFAKQDATIADLSQAETRLAQGLAQQIAAEGTISMDQSHFKQTTGLLPAKLAPPPPLPDALLPATRDELVSLALANPNVREAEQAVAVAAGDVKIAESALKPDVSLILSSQYQKDVSQGNFSTRYNEVLLNLQVPLYMGGGDYARSREAKVIVGQRKQEVDEARQQVMDKARQAWDQLYSARGQISQLKVEVVAAERAWKAVQVQVRRGYREVIDELNAEQEYINDEIALVRAQHDDAIATFAVLNAVGRLTARALRLPVPYYDPAVNYKAESDRWFGTGIPDNDDLRRSRP